jgi:peptide maturation system protein (TIGR04066 family)
MKKKALIYPYSREFTPILRCRELLLDYEIVSVVSPKGFMLCDKDVGQADFGENIGIIVKENFKEEIKKCDAVIISDCIVNQKFIDTIISNIEFAIESGKNVVCTMFINNEVLQELRKKSFEKNVEFKYICNETFDIEINDDENIIPIDVPIIMVEGVTEGVGKFGIELSLTSELRRNGYKVSTVCTRNYSELVNLHSIPSFMYSTGNTEVEKIVKFNRYVKSIELFEKPDIIIIGIPGGSIKYNDKLTNQFGIMTYLISRAVQADFSILCTWCDDKLEHYINNILEIYEKRFEFQIDCICISNSSFNIEQSDLNRKFIFNYLDNQRIEDVIKQVQKKIDIPTYRISDSKSLESIIENIINKLSDQTKVVEI